MPGEEQNRAEGEAHRHTKLVARNTVELYNRGRTEQRTHLFLLFLRRVVSFEILKTSGARGHQAHTKLVAAKYNTGVHRQNRTENPLEMMGGRADMPRSISIFKIDLDRRRERSH